MMLPARMRLLADPSLPANLTPWLWIAGAALILLILYFLPWRRGTASTETDGSARSRARAIEGELHLLAREISEMVGRADRLLDDKSHRLEALIQAADQRIATLRALESSAPPPRLRDHLDPREPDHANASLDRDPAQQAGADADTASAEARRKEASTGDELDESVQADQRHARIYAFHDQGLTARQIADHMLRPTGEIELILALRPPPEANE